MEGEQNRGNTEKERKKGIIVLELTIRCETKEEKKELCSLEVAKKKQSTKLQANLMKKPTKLFLVIF